MFAVIDVETTGGPPSRDRVTEVAVYRFDGATVVDSFTSLVNPSRKIDPFVVKLTGITDKMVANAPLFEEVAEVIERVTKDAIFVAHNVSFDYRMVRKEMMHAGYSFKRKQLCTVQASQKILKGQPSYSLGKLTKNLGIELEGRHRAYGDAMATVELLRILINKGGFEKVVDMVTGHIPSDVLPSTIPPERLEQLPEAPGIVTFRDEEGRALYIRAFKNAFADTIRFLRNNAKNHRFESLFQGADKIECDRFSSIVVSQLEAYRRVREEQPVFNKRREKNTYPIGLSFQEGKWVADKETHQNVLFRFGGKRSALKFGEALTKEYGLHATLEDEELQKRYAKMLSEKLFAQRNFFIVRPDYNEPESWIIGIANHQYVGYGRVANDILETHEPEEWVSFLQKDISTPVNQRILKKYLSQKKRSLKIVPYGNNALNSL